MTFYRADQTVVGTTKKFEWQPVIPATIADIMFQQICVEKPIPQYVEIIADETPLLVIPLENSPILKMAKKGNRFLLIPDSGETVWFNIVDEKTQQDYWTKKIFFKIVPPGETQRQHRWFKNKNQK